MTKNDVLEHGLRKALAALPLAALAVIALLAIAIRSEAGPGQLAAAATPEPDSALTQQCIDGAAVGAGNDGLASDCALLLGAKDTLRGTETLNWSADTAIASWEGITVGGSPLRATELVLDGWNSWRTAGRDILLNGTIPAALGGLSKLQRLTLSRNALTGTIPVELAHMSELASLQLYSNQLTGGIPPELGRLANLAWAFDLSRNQLSGSIPVELGKLSNLRTVRLQHNQLTGSIPAALGDLSNLNQLNLAGNTGLTGCIPASLRTTRLNDLGRLSLTYCTTTATHALTTSAAGNGRISPLPGTYSYLSGASVTVTATPDEGFGIASWGGDCAASGTATTCTLTMSADRTASVTFGQSAHTLTVTVTGTGTVTPDGTTTQPHGDEVTLTASWDDATHDFDGWGGDCVGTASTCVLTMDADKTVTATFAALPADRCAEPADVDCIRAVYLGAPTDYAQVADIPADKLLTPATDGRYYVQRGQQITVVTAAQLPAGWTRFYLVQTPLEFGTPSPVSASQLIPPVGTTYTFTVSTDEAAATLITYDLTAAKPHPVRPTHKPVLGAVVVTTVFSVEATTFRYNQFDTTGAVATPGSYAFLSDPDDTTTAVTTYEALRDGTTTGLLIHKSDAHGASQVALYDAVEAGDLLEWHEAADCFVRYQVTEVMPDPAGAVPRKLLAVEWMTYAFTGCSGPVSADAVATVDWDELPDLGGPSLTAPVVHGVYQIVPVGWAGVTRAAERSERPPSFPDLVLTTDIAEARTMRHWREPSVPAGWTFDKAEGGGYEISPVDGYCAWYATATGERGLEICAKRGTRIWYGAGEAAWHDGSSVRETRVVAGRPASVIYSTADRFFPLTLRVYDAATQVEYTIYGKDSSLLGGNVDGAIAIAASLFVDTPPFRRSQSAPVPSRRARQSALLPAAFEFNVYAGAPLGAQEIATRGWHSPPKGKPEPGHGGLDWKTANQGDAVHMTVEKKRFIPSSEVDHPIGIVDYVIGRVTTVLWTTGPDATTECTRVKIDIAHGDLTNEEHLGTLYYWHVIPDPGMTVGDVFALSAADMSSHELGIVAASPWIDPVNFTQTYANTNWPKLDKIPQDVFIAGVPYKVMYSSYFEDWYEWKWRSESSTPENHDGETCLTIGDHLHQGADGRGVWPNKHMTAYPSKTLPAYDDDGFGFDLTFSGYSAPVTTFCSDIWVAKILPVDADQPLATPTVPCAAPDNPPDNLTVVAGDQKLTLSWDEPELEVGEGAAITGYRMRYRETAPTDKAWSGWRAEFTATSRVLTGLTNGRTYAVQVRAVNRGALDVYGFPAGGPPSKIIASPRLPVPVTLATSVRPAGAGEIVATPSGPYVSGTTVTLTATGTENTNEPLRSYVPVNWDIVSGGEHRIIGASSSIDVTLDSDTTVTVTFDYACAQDSLTECPPPAAPAPATSGCVVDEVLQQWTCNYRDAAESEDRFEVEWRYRRTASDAWTTLGEVLTLPASEGTDLEFSAVLDFATASGTSSRASRATASPAPGFYEVRVRACLLTSCSERVSQTLHVTAPVVSVSASSSVTEGTAVTFRITRTGSTGEALPVNVNVVRVGAFFSGAAPTLATIPPGFAWYDLEIATVPDSVDEADGSVTVTLEPGGNAYNVGTAASATVAVLDDDLPLVSVGASAGSVTEGEGVTFTVSRRNATPESVTVDITVRKSGDFFTQTMPPTSVVIPVNATDAAAFTIETVGDTDAEPDGSVAATIATRVARYRIGTGSVEVAVGDDDRTGVTISPNTASVTEGANAVFTVSRGVAEVTSLRVYVSASDVGDFIDGTAPTSVLIAANQASRTFTVRTDDDTVDETDGAITATIQDRTTYSTGSPGSAIMAVLDNDPTVTISRNAASMREDANAVFTVRRDRAAATSIRVYVDVSEVGDFIDGTAPTSVLIGPNRTTATLTVSINDDTVDEPDGSVTAAIRDRTTYSTGSLGSATIAVQDNDPTVTIIRNATPVTEGTDAVFTVSRDRAASTGIRVYVDVSEVGTFIDRTPPGPPRWADIGANQTTATLTVGTDDDTVDELNGSVTATIAARTSYTVGARGAATIAVLDNDEPSVRISRSVSSVTEGANATYTITRDLAATTRLRVYVSVTDVGDFIDGTPPAWVDIGPNRTTGTLTVGTDDDTVDESNGSITATISPRSTYSVGSLSSATIAVSDNDPTVTIIRNAVAVTEGTSAVFTVSRDRAASTSIRVYVGVSQVGDFIDYGPPAPPASVLIGPNRSSATLTVRTDNDNVDEPDGSITATISPRSTYSVGSLSSATIAVSDNDPTVTIIRNAVAVTEGTSAVFTVSRDRAASTSIRVYVGVSDGPGDFIAGTAPTSVLIGPNRSSATLTVRTDNDNVDEPNGSITAAIADRLSYTIGSAGAATITVRDNDDLPLVRINRSVSSVTEGANATWTVTRDAAASSSLRVYVNVSDGTGDFIAGTAPASVLIRANQTTGTLTVATDDDNVDEPDGSVTATISPRSTYSVGSARSAAITVRDNDPTVTISRNAVAVTEGTSAVFTVRRDRAATSSIRIYVGVSDGTGDFIAGTAPSSVLIRANQTTGTLTVRTDDDIVDEPDGSVTATISPRSTYSVGSANSDTTTVRDNDPTVRINRSVSSVIEGANTTWTVTRDRAASTSIRVYVDVSDGTGDFISGTAATSVLIGANRTTGTLTVRTDDDNVDEINGSVTATISPRSTYSVGSPGSSAIAVRDNDPTVTISRNAVAVTEGTSAVFTVRRDRAATSSIRIYVGVSDGTGDFIAGTAPSSVLIRANQTTGTLTVRTDDDNVDEINGSVTATISPRSTYSVGSPGSSAIAVRDNDPTVTISRNAVAVTEGTSAVFTVRRDRAASTSIRIYVGVSDGTGDFIAGTAPSSVLIRANQTTGTLTVRTDDDNVDEINGSVTATISPRSTYSVGSASSATITVRDNDIPPLPVVTMTRSSATPASVTEGTTIVFLARRTGSTAAGLPVTWSITQSGSFLLGTPRTSGTIPAGFSGGTFTINTSDDTTDEANGSVTATLTGGGSTYTIGTPASSTVTVLDNDATRYYLTASATANGSASGSGWYDENTSATVTATSTQDFWVFTDWTGDVADSTASSTTVYMDETQSVTANFDHICNIEAFFPGCSRRDEDDAPLPGTTGNASPTVSIDTAAQTVAGGASIELAATAVAVDGKIASHSWSGTGSFADGTAEDTTWTAPAAAASERTITLTLTVTSDGGASASASIEIVVAAADSAAGPGNEPGDEVGNEPGNEPGDDMPMEDTEPAG